VRYEKQGEDTVLVFPEETLNIANAEVFKEQLNNLHEAGFRNITLDFSEVEELDSAGLGKILVFHKKMREQGGELKIINVVQGQIKKMFDLIQLDRFIHIS